MNVLDTSTRVCLRIYTRAICTGYNHAYNHSGSPIKRTRRNIDTSPKGGAFKFHRQGYTSYTPARIHASTLVYRFVHSQTVCCMRLPRGRVSRLPSACVCVFVYWLLLCTAHYIEIHTRLKRRESWPSKFTGLNRNHRRVCVCCSPRMLRLPSGVERKNMFSLRRATLCVGCPWWLLVARERWGVWTRIFMCARTMCLSAQIAGVFAFAACSYVRACFAMRRVPRCWWVGVLIILHDWQTSTLRGTVSVVWSGARYIKWTR